MSALPKTMLTEWKDKSAWKKMFTPENNHFQN